MRRKMAPSAFRVRGAELYDDLNRRETVTDLFLINMLVIPMSRM